MKILQTVRQSISLQLLLLFISSGILIILVVLLILNYVIRYNVSENITPHINQYLQYLYHDIGSPPNIEKAKKLAEKLPIEISIDTLQTHWSSRSKPIDSDRLQWESRYTNPQGVTFEISINRGSRLKIAQIKTENEQLLIWTNNLQQRGKPSLGLLLGISLALILSIQYLLIRRLFRPLKTIQSGIQIIGSGELSHRIKNVKQNELGKLADNINQMTDDIEQILDAKRELLLAISHELRSPLTRAKISIELLNPSPTQADIARDLREMENLITELLEAERLKGRHHTLDLSSTNLNKIIHTVINEHFPKTDFQLELTDKLPLQQIDIPRMHLVVRNLINNALKHQPENSQPMRLQTTLYHHQIRLSVQDFGSGISAEHLLHITEPFYRADTSRQRKTGGFGLGLYLVKLIVEAHNGKLHIASQENKGTTVQIYLPVFYEKLP
jgi:signal transduction histidine kinase